MAKERYEFQAETKQLLDLMIHSIYTNQEIFLRELISNASDAIDKLHYESLTNRDLLEGNDSFSIHLAVDGNKLTIADNGIGMDKQDIVNDLGTIARSGTKAFLERLREAKESGSDLSDKELIGQFGVGFYSAFMVADSVTVETRKAGTSQGFVWESTGDGAYTLDEADVAAHGTTITLTLKPEFAGSGEENFADSDRLCGRVTSRTSRRTNTRTSSGINFMNGKIPWKFSTQRLKEPLSIRLSSSFPAVRPITCTIRILNRAYSFIRVTSLLWTSAKTSCPIICDLSRGLSILPICPSIFRVKSYNRAVM